MHIKHLVISLSSIVIIFLVVVFVVVLKTRSSLPTGVQPTTPITPVPVESSKLPEALQKIQNKARQANTNDLQLVGAPIGTSPGSVIQPTSATSEAILSPSKVPTARPVQ